MNIFDTFIGVLLAFIVKDFYDIFMRKYVIVLFNKYKNYVKGNNTIDKEIMKLVKEGKLKLIKTELKGNKKSHSLNKKEKTK